MADAAVMEAARGFVEEVMVAVSTALETNDATSLTADIESAVQDFESALDGEEDDELPPEGDRRDPVLRSADEDPLFSIIKTSEDDERMIWGWGSVITVKGVPLVDRQGDVIELHELKSAVYDFMDNHRVGGEMHKTMGTGTIVESMVFSEALQKALGIDLGKEGWFIGMKVHKDETWARVKSGELRSFSLGGSAERVAIA